MDGEAGSQLDTSCESHLVSTFSVTIPYFDFNFYKEMSLLPQPYSCIVQSLKKQDRGLFIHYSNDQVNRNVVLSAVLNSYRVIGI